MIILADGPAAGEYSCNRAPEYLRAVVDAEGRRAILDGPEDAPGEGETLHVYRRTQRPFTANVCGRGLGGEVVRIARYALMEVDEAGPLGAPAAWRAWCRERGVAGT